ncbi:MAG: hypothetical protein AAF515_18440 [Pseudomonadota bacterium]
MSVESFDPAASPDALSAASIERLLTASAHEAPYFGMEQDERMRLAGAMTAPASQWRALTESLASDALIDLIRLLTLAEETIPGWTAGAKSPVIPLARLLKDRGDYPADLTRWIRTNSSNRFLPHGSLMDRL